MREELSTNVTHITVRSCLGGSFATSSLAWQRDAGRIHTRLPCQLLVWMSREPVHLHHAAQLQRRDKMRPSPALRIVWPPPHTAPKCPRENSNQPHQIPPGLRRLKVLISCLKSQKPVSSTADSGYFHSDTNVTLARIAVMIPSGCVASRSNLPRLLIATNDPSVISADVVMVE